jgi:hypothetical protein
VKKGKAPISLRAFAPSMGSRSTSPAAARSAISAAGTPDSRKNASSLPSRNASAAWPGGIACTLMSRSGMPIVCSIARAVSCVDEFGSPIDTVLPRSRRSSSILRSGRVTMCIVSG